MSRELLQQALQHLVDLADDLRRIPSDIAQTIAALEAELAKPEMPTKIFAPNLEQILNAAGFYRREAVCCGDYEKCIEPCTPKGEWLAKKELAKPEQEPFKPDWANYRQGLIDGAAQAKLAKPEQEQEPESHIVKWSIPVDPNNFGEPLAQPEHEPEIVRRVKRYMGKRRESVGSPHITAKECIALANWIDSMLFAPSRKEWVGLTDAEIEEAWGNTPMMLNARDGGARKAFALAIETKLKELNT